MASKIVSVPNKRIVSIDALRGFDMFLIIGGSAFFRALFNLSDAPVFTALANQFYHSGWDGFTVEDLIFPLFLFIVGVCMPFSITKRLDRGDSRDKLYRHIVIRFAVLFLFGLVYNGLFGLDFESMRYAGVLQRIALCYLFTALILMNFSVKGQSVWFAAILALYFLAMKFIPVPGWGAGVLTPEGNLASYIDRLLLPGQFCCFEFGDNEGILSTIPAVSTTLLGVLSGHWLRSGVSPSLKHKGLYGGGIALVVLALLWNFVFPINKLYWSSSYVLLAGGLSMILLGMFYWTIDIRGFRKWAFPFIIIGLNPITIYMAQGIIDFESIAEFFTNGVLKHTGDYQLLLGILSVLVVKWLFLYFLYRKKIFLKV